MQIRFVQSNILKTKSNFSIVLLSKPQRHATVTQLDKKLGNRLLPFLKEQDFQAEKEESQTIPCFVKGCPQQVSLFGIGQADEWTNEQWLRYGALCARKAKSHGEEAVAIELPNNKKGFSPFFPLFVQGLILGNYSFEAYLSDKSENHLEKVVFTFAKKPTQKEKESFAKAAERAVVLAEGNMAARNLVNEPPNVLNPEEFAQRAQEMAKEVGLSCEILDEEQMYNLGMNLFLAVGSGSANESRLIHLTYKPKRKKRNSGSLALVGKGVTFDSGGLSIKPTAGMINMHCDMAGGAAVFGAMQAIAQLQPPIEVHGYIGCAENMTGSDAFRINDVITGYSGTTVEIKNTDAEGRLVLADTLAYAVENGATEIIDLATLTGACLVALGEETAGLMGNNETMKERFFQASEDAGESFWELPLLENLRPALSSHVADIANVGGRWGGTITAALFLEEFVGEDTDWMHLDIAGPSFTSKDDAHWQKGGTGFPVASLVEYVFRK